MAVKNGLAQKIKQEIVKTNIDASTGEVIGQTKQIKHFDAAFREGRGYLWWNKKGSAKSFYEIAFPKDMTMIDRGRLATLSKCIFGDTNCLGYRGHGGFKAYDIKQIGELLLTTPEQAERFIARMKKMRIIKPVLVTFGDRVEPQYYVNPLYYFSGRYLSSNLYALFYEELDKYLPEWVKDEFAKAGSSDKTKTG